MALRGLKSLPERIFLYNQQMMELAKDSGHERMEGSQSGKTRFLSETFSKGQEECRDLNGKPKKRRNIGVSELGCLGCSDRMQRRKHFVDSYRFYRFLPSEPNFFFIPRTFNDKQRVVQLGTVCYVQHISCKLQNSFNLQFSNKSIFPR